MRPILNPLKAAFVLAALFAFSNAEAEFGNFREFRVDGRDLTIATTRGQLRLTAHASGALEVHYLESGVAQLPSFAIADETPGADIQVSDSADTLMASAGALTAIISKRPVSIRWTHRGEDLIKEETGYFAFDSVRGFRFGLAPGEKLLGGGQRVLGMDRRGHRLPLYNKA
ncbi:MAG: glycosyl hydrolase, partial [Xanthomonadales bacterium]|nr:glycosyl hydrolase [Xanthomonadales bacterium]